MLASRTPIRSFPLSDQEILLRLLHKTAQRYAAEYEQQRGRTPANA
jgi:hypothetical protein